MRVRPPPRAPAYKSSIDTNPLRFLRQFRKRFSGYEPLIEIFISKKNLLENFRIYQRTYPGVAWAPVLKSNAYGHGLVLVAHILETEDIAFLVVDSLYEAMMLRAEGIRKEILIIGYTTAHNIRTAQVRGVAFTITSLEQLEELAADTSSPIRIHLKIDTGMHRQGLLPDQVDRATDLFKAHPALVFEGVCSHFADADGPDSTFTKSQIQCWQGIVKTFKHHFPRLQYFHIANTAGAFYANQAYGNVARLGLGLYGMNSSPFQPLPLKPVLEMRSIISSVKTLPAGERVGYNGIYTAPQPTIVATVPVGYFEGVDRRLSNNGFFKVRGIDCPIVGRVSMNITSIDVSAVPNAHLGEEVVVISSRPGDPNSVENIAKAAQTILWEILVHIPQHVRRTIIE